ncbi:IS66 family transposase [Aromatoleum bremense]|uniref:IS66 family transposase n=1 Tax=Aromatoleum bremense TaxID=76115 RepID=UPI001FD53443|nr:transposase [Aromatoleum bremense]
MRGLAESTDRRAAGIGTEMAGILKRLQAAVYAARATSPPLPQCHAADIAQLRRLCERHRDDPHAVVGSLAREFLNDWDVILRPLDEPHLPLTNNAAEQALRHWVIARRISHGTRSATGSRAFALLASVIDTCRRRGACAWRFLGAVIHAARRGLALPSLPTAAA